MFYDNEPKEGSSNNANPNNPGNLLEKKEKIYYILKMRGPCLPAHVTKQTELSMLFASTLLSELVSDKKVKISEMKVGGSPVYYIPGQEEQLERFHTYLPSKEKEAFIMLKEKQILEDKEMLPPIRVALRQIKDFATPIAVENKLFWKFHSLEESKAQELIKEMLEKEKPKIIEAPQRKKPEIKKQEKPKVEVKKKEELDIFDKTKKTRKRKIIKAKQAKKEDRLFSDIKNYLAQKQIEILGVEGIAKNEFILKIREKNQEYLLIALNKKRVDEKDIFKAYKKALEAGGMKFKILSFGEPLKKIKDLLEAFNNLDSIEKVEK